MVFKEFCFRHVILHSSAPAYSFLNNDQLSAVVSYISLSGVVYLNYKVATELC